MNSITAPRKFRKFTHFRERLIERYDLDLSVEECESLAEQINKGLYLKCQFSLNSLIVLVIVKGKLLTVAYDLSGKYITTCLNTPVWQKEELKNEILSFSMYGKYFDKLKESNLKLERFQTCLG